MRLREKTSERQVFTWTAAWVAGLLLLNLIHQVSSGLLVGGIGRPGEVAAQVPGWIGFYLPFAAFAGGVAGSALQPVRSVLRRGVLAGLVSYLFLAYGSPIAIYHDQVASGAELESLFPFGPVTPGGLLARRSAVVADPPEEYTFRLERPLTRPPNWLTYKLHSKAVIALYAVLAMLLGHLGGKLTTGLSPPDRRNARWVLGLFSSVAFFLAEAVGGRWVRADPSNSGALGAWLPYLVPLVELGILLIVFRVRRFGRAGPPESRVQ